MAEKRIRSNLTVDGIVDVEREYSASSEELIGISSVVSETAGHASQQIKGVFGQVTHTGVISPLIVAGGDFRTYISDGAEAQNSSGLSGRIYITDTSSVTTNPNAILAIFSSATSEDQVWGIGIQNSFTHSGSGDFTYTRGTMTSMYHSGTGNVTDTSTLYTGHLYNTGGGTLATATGIFVKVSNEVGTITEARAGVFDVSNEDTIGTAAGIVIGEWANTGTITTSYGLKIDSTIDVGTTKYAIYSLSTSLSSFAGQLKAPDATDDLHVPSWGQVRTHIGNSTQAISAVDVDFSAAGIFTKTITGNTTLTFSNPVLNKRITLVITGDFTLTFPGTSNRIFGTYDGTVSNYISVHCTTDGGSPVYWHDIRQAL